MREVWEYLPKNEPFNDMPVEEQRNELLAAVGLLVEALDRIDLTSHVLMPQVLRDMGHRYGPWSR